MSLILSRTIHTSAFIVQRINEWERDYYSSRRTKEGLPALEDLSQEGVSSFSRQTTTKYPEPLITEYRLLTRKKRLKQLSEEEQGRLQVVMNTIAELDRADPSAQVWKEKYNELATELQQIRREAEALLAARKP